MEAQELRIGNVLFWSTNNDIVVVDHVHIRMCSVDRNNFNKLYKPIPLTEEWLVKFRFRCYDNKWDTDEIIIMKNGDGYLYLANQLHVNLFYVHQLQNLYFALTGKEL